VISRCADMATILTEKWHPVLHRAARDRRFFAEGRVVALAWVGPSVVAPALASTQISLSSDASMTCINFVLILGAVGGRFHEAKFIRHRTCPPISERDSG
jgi:hypothetical protein